MSEAEKEWLAKACPYFKPAYRDFLGTYRFKPEQVEIKFTPAEGTEESPGELYAVVWPEWGWLRRWRSLDLWHSLDS